MSAAVKWVTTGVAAAILVVMYALGMGASSPAAAHGWHCYWARGHRHLAACDIGPGIDLWWGGRRRRRRRRRRRWALTQGAAGDFGPVGFAWAM